ncbi:MAG: universal stress protein [Haloferacaceae archaeon]
MEVDIVLAPVDGSAESTRAARYAVAVAAKYDAGVHAAYVLDEKASRAVETGAVDDAELRAETRSFLADLRALADEAGVSLQPSMAYGYSTQVKTRHPGSVVLDLAETVDADFLVVPREPESHESLERTAEYVLLYASQPVLSV